MVMFCDGTDVEVERSHSLRLQRMTYGAKKKSLKHYAVRRIVFCTRKSELLYVSKPAPASFSEVELVENCPFLDDVDAAARNSGVRVNLTLTTDRGFFKLRFGKSRFTNLTVSTRLPFHLNPPRGKKWGGGAAGRRARFAAAEVRLNKAVASERACNEIAILRFKFARLFQRRLPSAFVRLLPLFDAVAVALAQMKSGVEPVQLDDVVAHS